MSIEFKILGKPWVIRALSVKKYHKKNGNDSIAITHVNKRKIDLSPDGIDKETIIHELVHAYLVEMCTYSADLDDDNVEEICAELFAKRGQEILRLGQRLFKLVNSPAQ